MVIAGSPAEIVLEGKILSDKENRKLTDEEFVEIRKSILKTLET